MKTLLICHEEAKLDQKGIARWLASFSNLVGIIVLQETKRQIWGHIRREVKRVGIIRSFDVIAFHTYYKLFLAKRDKIWLDQKLNELYGIYPEIPKDISILHAHSPNTPEAEQFIRKLSPDIMIARCKTLLKENIFSIPSRGTFIMHPGICPEYRNAHGCFWALANDDLNKVGMTFLKVDAGVDTGLIYGYYSYNYDEVNESHMIIQRRIILENLESLQTKVIEIYAGRAVPLDTSGRPSATWGQPWLTSYLKWKCKARMRHK